MHVDSRQPPTTRELFIAQGWVVKALDAGDYLFTCDGKTVGIEEKRPADLIGSILGKQVSGVGRLKDQLLRLKAAVDVPVLLLTGTPTADFYGACRAGAHSFNWPYASLMKTLLSVQLEGILLAIGEGDHPPQDSWRNVLAVQEYIGTRLHLSMSLIPERKYKQNKAILSLMCIPDVSNKTARNLLAEFGSLYAVAAASEIDLRERVDGIGPQRAKAIASFFRGDGKC